MIWTGGQLSSLLVYIIGLLFSFPVYSLFYGFFGGWDDDGLLEFRRAVDLSNFVRPIAWIPWKASDMGARISPLHGRFPISIYREAIEEAKSLTKERVALFKNHNIS